MKTHKELTGAALSAALPLVLPLVSALILASYAPAAIASSPQTAIREIIESRSHVMHVPLSNGQTITLAVDSVQALDNGSTGIAAHVQGDLSSEATLIFDGSELSGNIHIASEGISYQLKSDGDSGIIASPEPTSGHEPHGEGAVCGADDMTDDLQEGADAEHDLLDEGHVLKGESAGALALPMIDLLVAYTPKARIAQGGTEKMLQLIRRGITDTNMAFEKSGVFARVRLAGTIETKHNETGSFEADLRRLVGTSDRMWDELHRERDRVRADQVTLIGAYTRPTRNLAGVAYNACRASSGRCFASKAFSVVKARYFNQYTFTHELGHNLGVNHGDGYLSRQGSFQTMMLQMSYGERRIRLFSSPEISFGQYAAGDSRRNSVSIINRFAARFASFRN